MQAINIRPVTDLRNKFNEMEVLRFIYSRRNWQAWTM